MNRSSSFGTPSWTILPEPRNSSSPAEGGSEDEIDAFSSSKNKRKANNSGSHPTPKASKLPRTSEGFAPRDVLKQDEGGRVQGDFPFTRSPKEQQHASKQARNATPGPSRPRRAVSSEAEEQTPTKPTFMTNAHEDMSTDDDDMPVSMMQDFRQRHQQKHLVGPSKTRQTGKNLKGKSSKDQSFLRDVIVLDSDSGEEPASARRMSLPKHSTTEEIVIISSDEDKPPVCAPFNRRHSGQRYTASDRIVTVPSVARRASLQSELRRPNMSAAATTATDQESVSEAQADVPSTSSPADCEHPVAEVTMIRHTSSLVRTPDSIIPPWPSPNSKIQTPQINGDSSLSGSTIPTPPPPSSPMILEEDMPRYGDVDDSQSSKALCATSLDSTMKAARVQARATFPTTPPPESPDELLLNPAPNIAARPGQHPGNQDQGFNTDANGLWAPFYRKHPSFRAKAWIRQIQPDNCSQPSLDPAFPQRIAGQVSSLTNAGDHTTSTQSGHRNKGTAAPGTGHTTSGLPESCASSHVSATSAGEVSSGQSYNKGSRANIDGVYIKQSNPTLVDPPSPDAVNSEAGTSRRPDLGYLRALYRQSKLTTPTQPSHLSSAFIDRPAHEESDREQLGKETNSSAGSDALVNNNINRSSTPNSTENPLQDNNPGVRRMAYRHYASMSSELVPSTSSGQSLSDQGDEAICGEVLVKTPTTDEEMLDGASLEAIGILPGHSYSSSSSRCMSVASSPQRRRTSSRSTSCDPMDLLSGSHDGDSCYELTLDTVRPEASIFTWRDVRRALLRARPTYRLAQDIPHVLEDNVNALPQEYRRRMEMRTLFEAMIIENTAEDEPDSPPIRIYNERDSEPHPDWEFHYSNRMWYSGDVPSPDLDNLIGCDCIGRCDPKKRSCRCSERQHSFYSEMDSDFIYNPDKTLIYHNVYIHECNDLCSCDDTCPNRVVQHGRQCEVNIVKTAKKGWGVFNGSKKIPGGTFVGIYAGELLTEAEAHRRGTEYDQFGRTYLLDLDFNQDENGSTYTVDAYHAGNFTRFLNHSCEPNCNINPVYLNDGALDKPLLALFTQQDIEPWEELCFSYCADDVDGNVEIARKLPIHSKCYCGAPSCRGIMFA